jgi:hypothetical protein
MIIIRQYGKILNIIIVVSIQKLINFITTTTLCDKSCQINFTWFSKILKRDRPTKKFVRLSL